MTKKFTKKQIDSLRTAIGKRMSFERFRHTLGVEHMAKAIGEICLPDKVDVICAAALLHDVSKEYSEAEHLLLTEKHGIVLSDEDRAVPSVWHSITGPLVVMDEFPEFATEEVLPAIRNHTVGSPDMSIIDEIIFLSDYIEFGRTHEACVALRSKFLDQIAKCEYVEEAITVLHGAVVESLDNTIKLLAASHKKIHSQTKLTRNAIMAKIERDNNGK